MNSSYGGEITTPIRSHCAEGIGSGHPDWQVATRLKHILPTFLCGSCFAWSYKDNGKENGNYYIIYWGYIGIMEKKMETTLNPKSSGKIFE